VRYFAAPRLEDCLRIGIGTDEEMDALVAALAQVIGR
jgi:histidinol-phosphate/aromatic aminotransferase/cobyric acid decarboxylase-like protein